MKKFQGGGGVPRQTTIGGQRHDLAYINPFEADLLRAYGGSGEPGPGGIPAYRVYDGSYNPSTISRDRTQSTASISQQQRQEMDREINRPASSSRSSSSRSSSGQDNNPNSPSPTELANRAYAQANAERARQQVQAEQARARAQQAARAEQARIAQAEAAAEARRKQAEQSRREAAALAARNAARAEEERKEAARIARVQREAAEAQRAREAAEAARKAKIKNIALSAGAGPDPFDRPVPLGDTDSGGVTSVYQGPRPPVRPTVGEADAEGPAEATGILSGLPNMLDMLKGAAGDVTMGYYAGFGDPATQRANLIAAGYSEAEAQAYLDRTAATIARNEAAAQDGTRSGGDSSPAPIDPCPEGYRMDTATNACVPSDDVTDPEPDPVTPFPGITPPISTVPTVVGSPNYTQIDSPFTLPPLTPGGAPGILPMPDFGVAAADRGFMPTTYGGMPTDVDPFR